MMIQALDHSLLLVSVASVVYSVSPMSESAGAICPEYLNCYTKSIGIVKCVSRQSKQVSPTIFFY